MHAISECFKKPFPVVEDTDKRYDLTHVMDLCLQLNHMTIEGNTSKYQQSNIVTNELPFEFSSFKVAKVSFWLCCCLYLDFCCRC